MNSAQNKIVNPMVQRQYNELKEKIDKLRKQIPNKQGQLYQDFTSYEGQLNNESRHGEGFYKAGNDDLYYGKWENDQLVDGYILYNTKEIYSGQMKDSKKNGKGVFTYLDGSYYSGYWLNDKYEGEGVYQQTDGLIYDGQWKRGKKNGKGKLTFESGDYYDGQWQDDMRHGLGDQKQDDILYQSCNWQSDHISGNGKIIKGNEVFEGTFEAGQIKYGKFQYNDSSIYIGNWKNGKRHGNGTMTLSNGDQYEGFFKNDEFNGNGELRMKETGDIYKGDFQDGKFHGTGIYKYNVNNKPNPKEIDYEIYTGQFINGVRQGKGTYQWIDGSTYEGQWENNKMQGDAILTLNGKKKQVKFHDDKFKSEIF